MSLTASNLDLGSALIGGGTADQKRGVVYLENTASNPIRITQVLIDGADTADFKMDGLNAWPTLPKDLFPGERLDLGIVFAPGSGTPGPRTVKVRLVLSSGDTVDAIVTGVSGTRDLAVSTTTLNFDTKAGKFNRQTVTITNIGTLPVTLTKPIISGATASDFTLGTLPRLVLNAGQTEYLEVTYYGGASGSVASTLAINSDATTGSKVVALSGTTPKARLDDDNPTQGTRGGHEDVTIGGNVDLNAVSGVSGEVVAGGVALRQSVPNPGQGMVTISYRLAERGEVSLGLYDGSGRLVKVLAAGMRDSGEQVIQVNVSELASGLYHYHLVAGGQHLDRTMQVVK
jgi:hypothetical protein